MSRDLTPATVTTASRIMLPIYPLMCIVLAINYGTDSQRLRLSPALNTADGLLPLPAWAAMFALAGLILAVSLLARRRFAYLVGLVVMCAAMAVWAVVFAYASLNDQASFTAAAWPAFACAACWASIRSLTTRESS